MRLARSEAADVPRRPRARRILRVRLAIIRAAYALASLLPIRRQVTLATSHATSIGGNLGFLRDELARRDPPIHTIVLAYRGEAGLRTLPRSFWNGIRSAYRIATSRVFIV